MSSTHDYQTAIDILSVGFDSKLIAHRLAKFHPDIFVKLHNMVEQTESPQWHKDVIKFIMSGNYVGSIKEIRANTGLGLKEAKDTNDRLIDVLADLGYTIKRQNSLVVFEANGTTARLLAQLSQTARTIRSQYVQV